jgi:hypothetical protein
MAANFVVVDVLLGQARYLFRDSETLLWGAGGGVGGECLMTIYPC